MKPKNLDDVFPKEFVEQRKREYELKNEKKEPTFWDFLGEIGYYLGYPVIEAILDDTITLEQAAELASGARRMYHKNIYDIGVATQAGVNSAMNGVSFESAMDYYRSRA